MGYGDFYANINKAVNFKGKFPFELFKFIFLRNSFYKDYALKISAGYKLNMNAVAGNSEQVTYTVQPYSGSNPYVIRMNNYLQSHLKHDLVDAMVHGSLGNYDEISYSDFDALVIIKNEVLESPARLTRVVRKLNEMRSIMLSMDPLQHHGWFILAEFMFENFDETYFPSVLFNYSKSILHDKPVALHLKTNLHQPYAEKCNSFIETLSKSLKSKGKIKNMYLLKSELSRFMLLPAMYYAARHGKSIFKKESFAEVKKDFSNAEWQVMNDISSIRNQWDLRWNGVSRQIILKYFYIHHKLLAPFFPPIDAEIKNKIDEGLFDKMITFAGLMKSRLYRAS